jgi:hypothetical protein
MTPAVGAHEHGSSPETVTEGDAQYALDLVGRICRDVGPGVPGSLQERKRAEMIRRELEKHLGVDNVDVEEFAFAPTACLSAFPLSAASMLLAALFNAAIGPFSFVSPWITAVSSVTLSVCAIVVLLLEFVFGFEFIDPFFKKTTSLNVIGRLRRPGMTNVARVLIVSGHHDSGISFGGEEAGLRGSRRYVERHLDDLRRLDARNLNMEMIAYPEIHDPHVRKERHSQELIGNGGQRRSRCRARRRSLQVESRHHRRGQ